MIDSKYALKYSMPHSVVHIIDNSGAVNGGEIAVANDPSLLSTLVVTGAPMGEDNKIVPLTRADVVEAAFGMNTLTASDVKKYGQSVTYALDLIRQGVPVQFMRVTPPESTYATVSLVVQWRPDNTDGCLHVRFVKKEWPQDLPNENFKNTSRVNEALKTVFKQSDVNEAGNSWKQLAFINFISAGRGNVYNNMSSTINLVQQAKRPANVKYQFSTIDNRTGATVETFFASLMNTAIGSFVNANGIDSVNTVVGSRMPGSSIVIPYLNEEAVKAVYNDYMNLLNDKIENNEITAEQRGIYNTLNINIFDMIFGKYIYNGTSAEDKLPFYVVDMETSELPRLNSENIVSSFASTWAMESTTGATLPKDLYSKLVRRAKGVSNPDSEVFVGDIFVTRASSGSAAKPKMSIITSINQYTGLVTSMVIPRLFPLNADHNAPDESKTSTPVQFIIEDAITSEGSVTSSFVKTAIMNGQLNADGIVVNVKSATDWDLYCVEVTNADTGAHKLHKYPDKTLYAAFDRTSHSAGKAGTGNAFGFEPTDGAATKVGCAVVDASSGSNTELPKIQINGIDGERITVNRLTGKRYGTVPSDIRHDNISGSAFDIKIYPDDAAYLEWSVSELELVNAGGGYSVGDLLYVSIASNDKATVSGATGAVDLAAVKLTIEVDSIIDNDGSGKGPIRSFHIAKSREYLKSSIDPKSISGSVNVLPIPVKGTPNAEADAESAGIATDYSSEGTGATVKIVAYNILDTTPKEIRRYVVSGSNYSLYSIVKSYDVVPKSYYSETQGINPSSEDNELRLSGGNAGFLDSDEISDIEFKWKYSALLVQALRGGEGFDRRILSPTRVPAKFMFDGGFNTIVGSVLSSNISSYEPQQLISASIIFTDDEKTNVEMFPADYLGGITSAVDIDVKAAMYDLMIQRCYDGIPEDKRPIGPGSGFQVYFDSGVTDAETTTLVRESFIKRFDNPNAIWDIGGFVETGTGISYTFVKHIVEDLFRHINIAGINKPYAGTTTSIPKGRFTEFFPDLDTTDWAQRENLYTSGGNAWILCRDGSLERKSQVTLKRDSATSDLLQESNMRTLSRLIFLLQEKIDSYLLNYNSDSVLKSLQDEVNNMFSNWVGNYVDALDIRFERDKNIDGADILVCYVDVTFRGLILRVPIICNVNSRQ